MIDDNIALLLEAFKQQLAEHAPPPGTPRPPRAVRRRRRKVEERGLPDLESRLRLAHTWLDNQHRLWPELASSRFLPPNEERVAVRLAEEFKERFLNRQFTPFVATYNVSIIQELGADYVRYSSENSNPASLDQQLTKALNRAREDRVFIPWEYVFADAAVTGTDAFIRHGYNLLKESITKIKIGAFGRLYIDEVGRAARDTIEALSLARLLDHRDKKMFGVSDGFSSSSPGAKLQLTLMAAVEEAAIESLRSRISRGRHHAFFNTQTAVKCPALGYRLTPAFNSDGQPICGAGGLQLNREVIDVETAPYVILAFTLRAQGKSRDFIRNVFNQHKVADRDTWVETSFREMFARLDYVGVDLDGVTKTYREEGVIKTRDRPEAEWRQRKAPHKRLISDELFENVRKVEETCGAAYASRDHKERPSRSLAHPKTPFSGTLRCAYCDNLISLGHSGSHPQFRCLNGSTYRCGCKLKGYKSARIIGEAIFRALRQEILTEKNVDILISQAKAHIALMQALPTVDTAPLVNKVRQLTQAVERLLTHIEMEPDPAVARRYHERISQNEKELRTLEERIKEANQHLKCPSKPPKREELLAMIDDLWPMLEKADPAEVAPVLRAITGPIRISQREVPGQDKPVWVASFTVNFSEFVLELANRQKYPTTNTLELLKTGGWIFKVDAEVLVEHRDRHARNGPGVKSAVDAFVAKHGSRDGAIQHAARVENLSWSQARDALLAAEGKPVAKKKHREKSVASKPHKPHGYRRSKIAPYMTIAKDVVRLRDVEQMSWELISEALSRSIPTCQRAYHLHHLEALKASGGGSRLSPNAPHGRGKEFHARLRGEVDPYETKPLTRARAGEIAKELGCGVMTVYRARKAFPISKN